MSNKTITFAAIGECMIELQHQSPTQLALGYAGDSFNVAYYLASLTTSSHVEVHYVTAVGDDPYSDDMLAFFQQMHIGTQHSIRLKNRMPGLYFIRTDKQGERSFYYYRKEAAARDIFKGKHVSQLLESLLEMDYLYLSSISVAILDEPSREVLFDLLSKAKQQGVKIVFDLNYRPILWPNQQNARQAIEELLHVVDIALPGLDEHATLFGNTSVATAAKCLHDFGVEEVVVKDSSRGCLVSINNQQTIAVPATKVAKVVDTTAAGDSFIGGYLAARLQGGTPEQAAQFANSVAAVVIQQPGAIVDKQLLPDVYTDHT